MLLDYKKKKLFDEAYNAYLSIIKTIENVFNGAVAGAFSDSRPSATDIVCDLDLFLQGALLKVATADGNLPPEETEFIMSLPDELEEVYSRNRGYKRFLKNISVESFRSEGGQFYGTDDCPKFLQAILKEDLDAAEKIIDAIETILNIFAAIDDNTSDVETEIIAAIISSLRGENGNSGRKKKATSPVQLKDTQCANNGTEELAEAMKELDGLVGLAAVKQDVHSSINLLKINNIRKEKGMPELQVSCHMVFTGQPGTGKTTVARIMAKIYKALGVVSKGTLVETDRSGMVAGYIGQTALKTSQVIRRARGGVLFIDEAHSLSSVDGSNDYGREAIDTLVKGMEDNRDDLVVIVAGYPEEMKKFINMNPGLRSRFNKYINFDNYTPNEMLDIFKGMCDEAQFILSPQAEAKVLFEFGIKQGDKSFGNARGVRNYFDRTATAQATRILSLSSPSDKVFRTILPEDLQ